MPTYTLPCFGQIELTLAIRSFSAEMDLHGKKVKLKLVFENSSIEDTTLQAVSYFLDGIPRIDANNRSSIQKDFGNGGEAADYINFYRADLTPEELPGIVDPKDGDLPLEQQLLNVLTLHSITLYPDSKNEGGGGAQFDYLISFERDACSELLVVNTDERGNFDYTTWYQ